MDNNFDDDTKENSKDEFTKVDLKNGTKNFKASLFSFFKNPLECLKEACISKDNTFFNVSIIFLFVWMVIIFINSLCSKSVAPSGSYLVLTAIQDILVPIISIGFMSLIIYYINPKKSDRMLTNTVSSVIICKIPVIIANLISLLNIVSNKAYIITDPIRYFALVISNVFIFFTMKYLVKEQNDSETFKYFALAIGIFYIIYLFLSFLNIYLV